MPTILEILAKQKAEAEADALATLKQENEKNEKSDTSEETPVGKPKSLFATPSAEAEPEPAASGKSNPFASLQKRSGAGSGASEAKPAVTTDQQAAAVKSIFAKPVAAQPATTPARPTAPDPMRFAQKANPLVAIDNPTAENLEALFGMTVELRSRDFQHEGQPAEYTDDEVDKIHRIFEYLEMNITNKDAVGDVTHTIIAQLRANPNLETILRPEEMGLLVRGVRQAYGILAAKKSEGRAKRTETKTAALEMARELKEAGFSFT